MQFFVLTGIDVVQPLERCRGFGVLSGGFLKCGKTLEQTPASGRPR